MGLLLPDKEISLKEEGAAFLTAALVAKSYTVETTSNIVKLWRKMQDVVPISTDVEYVSAILVTGKIMDFKTELNDPDKVSSMVEFMKKGVIGTGRDSTGHGAIVAAFLTSAFIAETREVETTSQTVKIWEEISETLDVTGHEDVIPGLLAVGRITELKRPVTDVAEVRDIYNVLRSEVQAELRKRDIKLRNRDVVTAFLASALIGASPKVERIRDSVNTWLTVREALNVFEDEDIISVILAAGRVKDLDALHMVSPDSLESLVKKIKDRVVQG